MVLMDHSSARPGDDRAHGRVRRAPPPGHFTAVAAVLSSLGSGTWARGRGRRDAAVGAGVARDAETGARERWSAGIDGQTGEWGRKRKEARDADARTRVREMVRGWRGDGKEE